MYVCIRNFAKRLTVAICQPFLQILFFLLLLLLAFAKQLRKSWPSKDHKMWWFLLYKNHYIKTNLNICTHLSEMCINVCKCEQRSTSLLLLVQQIKLLGRVSNVVTLFFLFFKFSWIFTGKKSLTEINLNDDSNIQMK